MAKSDREIIEAWQHQDAREDDEAYEGHIGLRPPHHVAAAVKHNKSHAAAAMALEGMANLSGGIVNVGGDSSVDSDVEKIVKWDPDLHATKTFLTEAMILSDHKNNSPKLDVQQKHHLNVNDQPAINNFRLGLPQAMAFKEINILCNAGWNTETLQKNK